jgi:hypothetical protein
MSNHAQDAFGAAAHGTEASPAGTQKLPLPSQGRRGTSPVRCSNCREQGGW